MTAPNLVRSDWEATVWFDGVGPFERRLEVTPAIAGWDTLSFRSYTFRAGQVIDGESARDEMTMVLLTGAITMEIDGPGGRHIWECAGRDSVFDGAPYAIYLPPHHTYKTIIHRDADCCYGRAPAKGVLKPRLFQPSELSTETDADGNHVTRIFRVGDTEHLLCHETIVAQGQWSTPRHPGAAFDEVVYYRTEPDTGWGLQQLGGEALLVQNGDAVIIRNVNHPVVASPETQLYALTYQVAVGT